MSWRERNCFNSINKSLQVVQIITKMVSEAVSVRLWYTGVFAEQLCYNSCNNLLQAANRCSGTNDKGKNHTNLLGSIKRCYKIPTEMKMIENTHKNLCGCPFQHCTGKKHKRVPFSFPHWANSKVRISTTRGFAFNNSHLVQESKFQKADEKAAGRAAASASPAQGAAVRSQ